MFGGDSKVDESYSKVKIRVKVARVQLEKPQYLAC